MTKEELRLQIFNAVNDAKTKNPFAPSITNSVTIDFVANAQLAAGGSAAMVYLADEAESVAAASKSMYINMGTQHPCFEETLPRAAKKCFESQNAWVLDPVAAGLGEQRTSLLKNFKQYKPKIVRGNASEIITLAKLWELDFGNSNGAVRGVDSTDEVDAAKNSAKAIAKYTGGAVAVSGKIDLVTDGEICVRCYGGSEFMPLVTGMGCSLGGVCSVYACVANPLAAAVCATLIYNLAGIRAEKSCKGPGSFYVSFIDEIYNATAEDVSSSKWEIE